MSWMNMLGNAALGYGVDRLAGGKGGIGAALGGLAGGTNYGIDVAGLFNGGGDFLQQGASDLTSGLFGSTMSPYQKQALEASQGLGRAFTPAEASALQSGYEGLLASNAPEIAAPTFFDTVSNFGKKYGDTVDVASKLAKGYGDITGGLAQQDMYESQADYTRALQGMQLDENRRKKQAQAQMQANIDQAFGSSGLRDTYYTA